MKIAFLLQNLNQESDSVGYDCIFQYKFIEEIYKENVELKIFSVVFNKKIHKGIEINKFSEFWDYIENNPDAHIIYHFCDGWIDVDSFIMKSPEKFIVRWHNNTPPWFYIGENLDFADDCNRGFETISKLARSGVRFMVNSEFTRRQLRALGGVNSRIDTVFPASSFLLKERRANPVLARPDDPDRPIELLFVGRVVPHKGHRHILSIAAVVQRFSGRQVRVVFAGALEDRLENYWSDLQAIAIRLGVEMQLPGLVSTDTLRHLYLSCDAFLCMSEHEGFGMPVFEAMRSLVPVIAWSSSAMADLLAGHPLAHSDFDIYRFAACVLAVLEPTTRQRIIDCQSHVLNQYTHDSVRGQLLDAIASDGGRYGGGLGGGEADPVVPQDIAAFIAALTEWIRDELGNDVETFLHDAPVNYVGLYDIAAYNHLIALSRNSYSLSGISVADAPPVSRRLPHVADNAISAMQSGDLSDSSRIHALLDKAASPAANQVATGQDANGIAQAGEIRFGHLHQILITADGHLPDELPEAVRHNIDSFRRMHWEAEHRLWSADEIRAFIAVHFEKSVLDAYDTLDAFALKADLARYCLLYVHGGLYSDLSNRFVSRWRIGADKEIGFFRDHKPLHGALWMNQNSILYAAPGQPEIRLAIDLVVENVSKREYGVSSLAPSGPVLFGRAMAVSGRAGQYQVGQAINVQVEGALNRSSYVNADGTMVAIRLQGSGGRPMEIGLLGTNEYGVMWEQRKIYGEGRHYFAHDNPAVQTKADRQDDGVHLPPGGALDLLPFPLSRGLYAVTWRFASDAHGHDCVVTSQGSVSRGSHSQEKLVLNKAGQVRHTFRVMANTDIRLALQFGKKGGAIFRDVTVRGLSIDPHDQKAVGKAVDPTIKVTAKPNVEPIPHIHHIAYNPDIGLTVMEEAYLAENGRIAATLHPDARQRIWTEATLRDVIAEHFAVDVVAAYDRLHCHAHRSELGRYCLLYALGGIYLDPWVRMVNPIHVPEGKAIAAFRSARVDHGASWGVDTRLLYAAPHQGELEQLIDQIVNSVREQDYGAVPSSITGAERLGRLLAVNYDAQSYFGGEVIAITPGMPVENDAFLSQDGRVVGIYKKQDAPSDRIWAKADHAWWSRRIYNDAT